MNPKKSITSFTLILIGILIGVFGYSSFSQHDLKNNVTKNMAKDTEERKILYWYDPMYPGTKFDKPGQSPFMDMELVPRYADSNGSDGVTIDPSLVQNLAVKTTPAKIGKLVFLKNIPANVKFNDYHFAKVQPRIDGFVEKTYALAIGDSVKEGQTLVDITVPGWASDQSEYLLLKINNASQKLLNGVRERLRLAGMPEELLKKIDKTGKIQTRLSITAPISGVLTALDVYDGMNVSTGLTLATIQGVDPIWITADVPESSLHLIGSQKRIRIETPAYPGKAFYTEQYSILPQGDPSTRTIPLRLTLANKDGLLRPGMTARIRLRGKGEESIIVPTRAVIDLGTEQRVIVRASDGSFIPKTVQVLRQSREETAIASGIEVGENIVVTGLFLIDSEANLSGALERMRRNTSDSITESKLPDNKNDNIQKVDINVPQKESYQGSTL